MLRYKLLALYAALIVNILIISMFQRLIPTGNTRVFAVMALWGWASAVAGISFLWNKHFNLVLSRIGLIVSGGIVAHI